MRRAHSGDTHTCLSERSRPARVRMHHTADVGKRLLQRHMCGSVAAGLPFTLEHAAFQINHDHILRTHAVVLHAGGLDHDETALPVNAGDIASGESDEAVFGQKQIGFTDDTSQFFQHQSTSVAVFSIGSAFL